MDQLLGTLPDTHLAEYAGVSSWKVRSRRIALGIPTYWSKYGKVPKYNVWLFDEIDAERAYWLGYIIADGCVSAATGGRKIVTVSSNDEEHIMKLARLFNAESRVYESEYGAGKRHFTLALCNKYLFARLGELGVTPRKSTRGGVPNIPRQFDAAFLLGLFDGDGSISLNNAINSWKVGYGTGSVELFKWVCNHIDALHLRYTTEIRKLKRRFLFLSLSGLTARVWLDWLYEAVPNKATPLARKQRRYEQMLTVDFVPPRWFDWETNILATEDDNQAAAELITTDKRNYGWRRTICAIYAKRRQLLQM